MNKVNYAEIKENRIMSRNFRSALGVVLVGMLIMALIILGGYAVFNLFFGGIFNIDSGLTDPGDGVLVIKGITKVICSGPVALLAIWAIQSCLKLVDRLHDWKSGRI
jgi:hypothetical protein